MSSNDLSQFRKVIREEVTQIVDVKISASENRIVGLIDEKIIASEKRILGGIGKFMAEEILPQIDDKADKTDIDRLERKIDKILDKEIDQERRIEAIEQIPAIAHQLRVKKSK